MIKAFLGFGRVVKQSKTVFRFLIQDCKFLKIIITSLNGNLVLEKKRMSLKAFILAYNKLYNDTIIFIDNKRIPSLNDQ
jgi:hypothetical protein